MFIVQYRKIFIIISAVLVVISAVLLFAFGLRPAIDFTGGTLIEVKTDLTSEPITAAVSEYGDGEVSVRATDEGYIIRTRDLSPAEIDAVRAGITSLSGGAEVSRVSTIGPALGEELLQKALVSIALVSLGIIVFITLAFWRVSKPVSSWIYGLVALGTLLHDVVIPAAVFAVLGRFAHVEVDTLFVVALLTVLGYSVHNVIVVMDRIRENLRVNQESGKHEDFDRTVGKSLMQTYGRSINTSLTVVIVLLALFFLGGTATEDFALALLIGVAAGAYSSIFFAPPMLVMIESWGTKKKS